MMQERGVVVAACVDWIKGRDVGFERSDMY